MRACTRCVAAGFLTTAHPIFRGDAGQRVMIVGQAPGIRANDLDVPWSGPSGVMLRGWMARAGFPEEVFFETWYLTSLTKCYPGKAPAAGAMPHAWTSAHPAGVLAPRHWPISCPCSSIATAACTHL